MISFALLNHVSKTFDWLLYIDGFFFFFLNNVTNLTNFIIVEVIDYDLRKLLLHETTTDITFIVYQSQFVTLVNNK